MSANTTIVQEVVAALRDTGRYATATVGSRPFCPAWTFYSRILLSVRRAGSDLQKVAGLEPLLNASLEVVRTIELSGGRVEFDGLQNLQALDGPVVMIGNHVSSLETFLLPGITLPFLETTFVLKRSLLGYPWLGATLRRLDAIAVDREDPRADLMKVLNEGVEHLGAGRSVVVFPQSTRTDEFDEEAFNSLGVKLAKRGGVMALPFAVDTRFWGTGRILKDFGPIRPEIPVRISFGAPVSVSGNGRDAQAEVVNFIKGRLEDWRGR
jgi:1-acyl-sn-glycerol-3-phosphate acyltransferase